MLELVATMPSRPLTTGVLVTLDISLSLNRIDSCVAGAASECAERATVFYTPKARSHSTQLWVRPLPYCLSTAAPYLAFGVPHAGQAEDLRIKRAKYLKPSYSGSGAEVCRSTAAPGSHQGFS